MYAMSINECCTMESFEFIFLFIVLVIGAINGDGANDDGDDYVKDKNEKFYSINYYMLPAKIAYFLNGGRTQIDKFFILFVVSIGFNPAEAGLIAGLQSIGGIIGAPAWGFIADKCRIHKVLVVVLCVLTIFSTCLQPVLGVYFGDRHRFKCPFEPNKTHQNNVDEFGNSVNHHTIFYSFLFIGIIARSFDASLTSFVDTGCLRRVQTSPKQTNYGRQRWMLSLGLGFGTMAYSIAISYYPTNSITSCETGVFVIYFGISAFLSIACYYLFKGFKKVSEEDQNKDITSILKLTFRKFDILFFYITALFSGIIRSIYFNFIFLHLKELNAIPLLFGFQAFVIAISGSIMSYFSAKVINFLGGTVNAMCATLFVWSLRFLCVSFITNPYHIFPIEIFHGLTSSLFLTSSFIYIKEISDPAILTFMTGKLNSLYRQLGTLIAYIVGGKLYHMLGARKLFLLSSAASAAWGLLFLSYVIFKYFQKNMVKRRCTTLFEESDGLVDNGDNDCSNLLTHIVPLSQDLNVLP